MFDPANEPAVPIDLPGIYDTFDEARRASFVNAMNYKQEGGKLCGYLCSYSPLELVDAAGAGAVGLCGMNNETIPDAETVLPKNLCPLIKGTYGFAPSPVAICRSIARSCRPTTAASSI